MSIHVNDFQWKPGENDAEYIRLLKRSSEEAHRLLMKATGKLVRMAKEGVGEWINVDDKVPPDEKNVLICCKTDNNRKYICEAYHINHHSIEGNIYWSDDIDWDYDEEEDKMYVPEGWYEVIHNWDEYGSVVIYDTVTHWMLMPDPPKE